MPTSNLGRRAFLGNGGLALFAAGLGGVPAFLGNAALAAPARKPFQRQKTLVTIFLRGGMDGLMAVQPYADAGLAALRPKLMLPKPGSSEPRALTDLGDGFGLHPAFAPLAGHYKDGRLAIVHGVGSPFVTRSHFDAEHYVESGLPGDKGAQTGWIGRSLTATQNERHTPFRALSMTSARPLALYGDHPSLAMVNVNEFGLKLSGGEALAALQGTGLEALYLDQRNANPLLRVASGGGAEAQRILADSNFASYKSAPGAEYPVDNFFRETSLARSLRQVAQLIKADVGLQVAFAEQRGSWDTHSNEFAPNGSFQGMADDLAKTIAAFWTDLGDRQDDVVVVTMTEFGRTVFENGAAGTDHGRATAMFVLGNTVKGGKVYGSVPERFVLDALEDQRDLPVTTDFRAVLAELAGSQLGVTDDSRIFPGWTGSRLSLFKT